MISYLISLQGSVALIVRQAFVMDALLAAGPLDIFRSVMFVINFAETWLHGLLLLSLLRERRWRFLITLWLAAAHQLAIIYSVVAVSTVLLMQPNIPFVLMTAAVVWTTWLSTYVFVHRDQYARDLLRLNPQSPAAGGGRARRRDAPAAPLRRPEDDDDEGLYLLVPSHSHPPLAYVPMWERDTERWRNMARIGGAFEAFCARIQW